MPRCSDLRTGNDASAGKFNDFLANGAYQERTLDIAILNHYFAALTNKIYSV